MKPARRAADVARVGDARPARADWRLIASAIRRARRVADVLEITQ
jgi:hypothetical protein